MLRNADYIYNNVIVTDESEEEHCKKAQVGVDLSVRAIYKITTPGCVAKSRTFVGTYEEIPSRSIIYKHFKDPSDWSNWDEVSIPDGWFLPKGTYICEVNEGCNFGDRDTGYIIMRSSLNRNGVTIGSAVWDPGFNSGDQRITIRLTVDNENGFYLEKNARVAQLLVWENESTELYDGQFQGGRITSKLV